MRIAITYTQDTAQYAVKDGQIYYVKLSKPCAISDLDDPFAELNLTPYADNRTLSYGVFVDDPNGYSARPHDHRKVKFEHSDYAEKRYAVWCHLFECNLTWEEAKKLAGWC